MAPFTVSIECDYEGFWRYNYVVMGSVMCAGEEVDFIKHRSEVAPVGAELREMPLGYSKERGVKLVSKEGDELTLYIYVIPHTLPSTDSTADAEVGQLSWFERADGASDDVADIKTDFEELWLSQGKTVQHVNWRLVG